MIANDENVWAFVTHLEDDAVRIGNQYSRLVLKLGIILLLFSSGCSNSARPSLRLTVRMESASIDSSARANATFYLLDEDPIYLVMNGGNEQTLQAADVYRKYPRLQVLAGKMNARRQAAYSLGPDVFVLVDQSRPLWEPHVIRSVQTDGAGQSRLDDLKPGSYWLMGYSQTPEQEAFWLLSVTVKVGR